MSIYGEGLYRDAGRRASSTAASARSTQLRARRLGAARRRRRAARAGADAGDQAAGAGVGLRAVEVRPGAAVPDDRRAPTASRPWRCASSTSTARARRSRIPYTGVLAIFASRLLNDSAPLIFEDGQQRRDFVSVHDVARACRLALEAPARGRRGLQRRQRPAVHRARGRRAHGRARWASRASRRRSPASTASATSATASPTSRRRAQRARLRAAVTLDDGLAELADWLAGQARRRPRRRGERASSRRGG